MWKMIRIGGINSLDMTSRTSELLKDGWEPFAVDGGDIYFRKNELDPFQKELIIEGIDIISKKFSEEFSSAFTDKTPAEPTPAETVTVKYCVNCGMMYNAANAKDSQPFLYRNICRGCGGDLKDMRFSSDDFAAEELLAIKICVENDERNFI